MWKSYDEILATMEETYTRLAGVAPESAADIGIRLKILAEQVWQLSLAVEEAKAETFPQTASGRWLDLHARQRGLSRKAATTATGEVVFSRATAAEEAIEIAAGTVLASGGENSLRFTTREKVVLAVGKKEVSAMIRCETAGEEGNAASGQLKAMVTPVQGIEQVNNPSPITGGEGEEDDEALRERLLDSYRYLTNGTNEAFYHNMALGYLGVSSVRVIPRIKGTGTVGIALWGPGVNAELMKRVADDIGLVKEVNVDVTVEKAVGRPVAASVEIAVSDGFSFEDTAGLCRERVEKLFSENKVGEALFTAQLVRALLNCKGVENCKIISPAADVHPQNKEIIILSSATINKMGS